VLCPPRVPVLAPKSHQRTTTQGTGEGRKAEAIKSRTESTRVAYPGAYPPPGYSRLATLKTKHLPSPRPRTISCTAPTILLLHYNSIHSNRYRTNTLYALLHTYSTTLTLFHDLRSSRKSAPLCQRQNTTRQIHSPALHFTPLQVTLDPADQTSSRCSPSSSPSRPSSLSPSRPSP
jgi:hypothetical protein